MRTVDLDAVPPQAGADFHRSPPSFAYKCRELLQQRELAADERFAITEKLGGYAFLDRVGAPHARVFAVLDGLHRLRRRHLRRPAVVKPLDGSSSIGVMALRPGSGDKYADPLAGVNRSFAGIVKHGGNVAARRGYGQAWLVEELLSGPEGGLPDDVKFYCFQGDVALVLQRRTRPGRSARPVPRFRWYGADFKPVDTGKHAGKIDEAMTLPENVDQLADLAVRVSRAAPFAFTRVDTLAAAEGPRVGEVNAWVGGYSHFDEHWDRRLGAAWEAAEVRRPRRWPRPPHSTRHGRYRRPWLARLRKT